MKSLTAHFNNEEEKKEIVARGENLFRARLSSVVDSIAERDDLRLITVSGPSCAGKTTSSAKLERSLEDHGYQVHVISIDDFFLDRDFLVRRAESRGEKPDFDSPDTIDFAAFADVISAISSSRSARVPIFSFQSGSRVGYRTLTPTGKRDVYLIEGIQAVYPEVVACFGKSPFVSLFVSPEVNLSVNGVALCAEDIRFLRRLVRDAKFRNAAPEFTFTLWETVRSNEEKNIFPNLSAVTYRIDSYLEYELYMIAPFAKALLVGITPDSEHFVKAERYYRMLNSLPEISHTYLPSDSLFREFIG